MITWNAIINSDVKWTTSAVPDHTSRPFTFVPLSPLSLASKQKLNRRQMKDEMILNGLDPTKLSSVGRWPRENRSGTLPGSRDQWTTGNRSLTRTHARERARARTHTHTHTSFSVTEETRSKGRCPLDRRLSGHQRGLRTQKMKNKRCLPWRDRNPIVQFVVTNYIEIFWLRYGVYSAPKNADLHHPSYGMCQHFKTPVTIRTT
jgi:hypothetical protein